ncbi:uncharacterized protein LOC105423030 [Pogonomyrmex barbatus]|uniref:Uncharacterized protein LOC105423030 n=1 Tax=Pogonomyrmex barbatus TaxID=144034 RepID=A0A6I9WGX5_9HYME|nr:uncharacterized protein LOC105423030 [Pogonomyrmex barbatus]
MMAEAVVDETEPMRAWFRNSVQHVINRKRERDYPNTFNEWYTYLYNKEIEISSARINHFRRKTKMRNAITEYMTNPENISSIQSRFLITSTLLQQETERYRRQTERMNYPYECFILGDIFSYEEGLALVDILTSVPPQNCRCLDCSLRRLPILAYEMARIISGIKGVQYPPTWDLSRQAGPEWSQKFQREYDHELNYLRFPCLKPIDLFEMHDVPSTSRDP